MSNRELTDFIRQSALELGFSKVGMAPAGKLPKSEFLREWLSAGHHGRMKWMENYLDKRMDVRRLYPSAKSVVAVGLNYYTPHEHAGVANAAKISRYAWGEDYHRIMKKRLKNLLRQIKSHYPFVEGRLFVDTAPIQDKLWAEQAGLGWQGKNTNIISRDFGSWMFLGELVLNVPLVYDTPMEDFCGSCTACIDACPTGALTPYKLAGEKCLSYITIEMWDEPIPESVKGKMEKWVFGCDICQEVCPWNRFQQPTREEAFQPAHHNHQARLEEFEELDEEGFRKRFKKSPVYRAKFENFKRNVRAVKENITSG
ncbi:MAG TPA: tRNA epoxyqueuosine(34) reductase QueG [Caldithrix abyssi]|uniref:Epoxyqueuosine reductase n=1 Tax=Caldithrix abyssi TaxID=187145 RepID=A0A7V5RR76_CALAY|nr:tRNA epoxyqueuosine(34) reductase QueG [Caldithrix abyssi]